MTGSDVFVFALVAAGNIQPPHPPKEGFNTRCGCICIALVIEGKILLWRRSKRLEW